MGMAFDFLKRKKEKKEKPVPSFSPASPLPQRDPNTVLPTAPIPSKNVEKMAQPSDPEPEPGRPEGGVPGIPEIETFFLNLFRHQLAAPEEAPMKIEHVPEASSGSEVVYRLVVQVHGQWRSRGMSISPLGEDTGSRSKCYYVIYDDHMVIKVPSKPIESFPDYLRSIRYERQLVNRLAPRECITPNLSIIMSKFRVLSEIEGLPTDELERRYIELLESFSKYDEFLKIGGHFVFFMDLSKYYFLSHVMKGLHDTESQIRDMMTSDAALILDCQEFEKKYGGANGWICVELQRVFRNFDEGIQRLETQSGLPIVASERQKKDWLFAHLTLQGLTPERTGLSASLNKKIETLLYDITDPEAETFLSYKKMAAEHARTLLFKRTGPKMEGVIANLLNLLDWMGQKNVAMRDLKPDNLFVAGDPQTYPQFLSLSENYSIGLIDLETAVDYKPARGLGLIQPAFGGTPAYATPSHFFPNKCIDQIHQDLPTILHLQDWYATLAIIFEVATGKKLFKQTSRQIRALVRHLNRGVQRGQTLEDIYWEESRLFWKSAVAEFEMNIRENKARLKSLKTPFPESMRQQFKIYLLNEMLKTDNLVRALVEKSAETVDDNASLSTYENKNQVTESGTDTQDETFTHKPRVQAINDLESLASLKQRSTNMTDLFRLVSESSTQRLSVRNLLHLMFGVVYKTMWTGKRESAS